MSFPLDATYTIALTIGALGGAAVAAGPRLNAMRRPHRLRSRLKTDLELVGLASQASLDHEEGITQLKDYVDASAKELILYEQLRRERSLRRRAALRLYAPPAAFLIGGVGLALAANTVSTSGASQQAAWAAIVVATSTIIVPIAIVVTRTLRSKQRDREVEQAERELYEGLDSRTRAAFIDGYRRHSGRTNDENP